MNRLNSPLLTDLYHLNMIQAYLDHGDTETAVFEFFVRKFPAQRGFLMAAGLEQALDFLENLRFSAEEIDWLAGTRRFDQQLLDQLVTFRFTGDVHAIPEGQIPDSREAKKLFATLGSAPVHVAGDRFRAKPRRDIPEAEKPTPAMRRAQLINIKKAQAAMRARRKTRTARP